MRFQRMKICVVTPRYMISGVALAQHRFARALGAAGHDVDFVIGRVDPGLTVPSSPGVTLMTLDVPKVRNMALPLWRYLRRTKPQIVFSAEDHLNTLVTLTALAARSRSKISGSSRVTPFDTYSNRWLSKRWVLKHLSRLSFRRADVLSCVSKDMVSQYRTVFGPTAPHVAIYNIVDDTASQFRMNEPVDEPWLADKRSPVIVAAGSLAPWKGFVDLIEAMTVIPSEVRLIILGEGPLRGKLEEQVERLGLGDRIKLPGFTDNPLKYFSRADLFVLSSHVEGLPNVLVEAMMCGCTPVATDCPTGPREVLRDGRYGYLVPPRNPAALAAGIRRALENPLEPDLLAEAVRPFEESVVIARHFDLLGLVGDSSRAAISAGDD
ncbi:MAG: glycosyltransferase [Sphingomicrobium sp.]|nr:glycosyltransferase [Sphingomonadales bacterium]